MQNETYARILTVVMNVLGPDVVAETDILDTGASSLEVLDIVLQLEDILHRRVELTELLDAPTIRDFALNAAGRAAGSS